MKKTFFYILLLPVLLAACTTYKTQYTGFRPPEAYTNTRILGDATIGAEAFAEKKAARDAFGFDIKGAGLLPVQLVMNNPGTMDYEVVTAQTFLVDQTNRYWQLIPNKIAVERVEQDTYTGEIAKGAGQKAMLGAAGGAILGAAVGIVTGRDVAEYTGKGAVIGGAGGALIGGSEKAGSKQREYRIADDLREKGLEGKIIPPASLANGFLFFPAEAKTARELRLQLREKRTGKVYSLVLPFDVK